MIQTSSTITQKTYPNQIDLKNSLSEFGLNPKDWFIKKQNQKNYFIENKDDQDFRFLGTIEENSWKELKLFSI